jgi:hypothetical protein
MPPFQRSLKVIRLPSTAPGITGKMARNSLERSGIHEKRKRSIENQAGAEKENLMVAIMQRHHECRKKSKKRKTNK